MDIGAPAEVMGATPVGIRSIGSAEGRFEGPGIKGTITVTDYFLTRPDGIGEPEVRGIMRTDDGAFTNRHARHDGRMAADPCALLDRYFASDGVARRANSGN